MKEKFDFTAEMNDAEATHLLDTNMKELSKLNDNVSKLRIEVENLSGSIQKCEPFISEKMHNLAVKFGATILCNFVSQIESKCKEVEQRMKKAGNVIPIPATAFYITIIILVALSSFFVCIIVANAEILHSAVIWKAVTVCTAIAVLEIAITIFLSKVLK